MMVQQYDKKSLTILFSVLFPIVLTLFITHILLFHEATHNSFIDITHNNTTLAKNINTKVLRYFSTPTYTLPPIEEFTDKEAKHMLDVKILIHSLITTYLFIVTIFFFLRKYFDALRSVLYGTSITFIIFLISPLIPFETFFILFHKIFFTTGTWTFSTTSTLIQTYPFEFFYLFARRIILTTLTLNTILFITALLLHFRRKHYKKN